MNYHCHLCGKITAKVKDASIAKGTAMICPHCVDEILKPREKRGDMTDSMPRFMSDFFRGFNNGT